MYLEQLDFLIGIVLGIFAVVAYIKGFFGWVWGKIKAIGAKDDGSILIPKRTLALVAKGTGHEIWWHMGKVGEDPAMQIVAHFTATNISKFGVLPISAKMKKPKYFGHVMAWKPDENIYGSYIIPKGVITELNVDFWISPPVKKEGEMFKADIAIIDQFGNEHWIKGVEFRYH